MSAYLFALLKIHDPKRYARDYAPAMQDTLTPYGGRYLTTATPFVEVEGSVAPYDRLVLIVFPDMTNARAWYGSAAYAPLLAVRLATATTILGFFEGGHLTEEFTS